MSYQIPDRKNEPNKVSVVIPVQDREGKIIRSVKSALNQTYKNIEVIVVDDGSKDRTYQIASSIKDKRVRVIALENRYGVSKARNVGIKKSEGEFIAFLDSDDEWVKDKIEKQISYIRDYKRRIDIVDCDWYVIDEKNNVELTKRQDGPTSEKKLLAFKHICSPPTVVARRNALKEVGAFDENISTAEDADLWVRLSQKYEFGHVPEALVKVYRGHRRRLGRNLESFLRGHIRFYVKHRDKYEGEDKIKAKFFEVLSRKLISMDEPVKGRQYIFKSIRVHPFNISGYLILLITFVSPKLRMKIKHIKNGFLKYVEDRIEGG